MAAWFAVYTVSSKGTAEPPLRLGILGDSGSDEYRGTDNRGGDYHTVTFNWVELLVRNRHVDVGAWGNYPEPRRTGYAYNWARSGANAADLIDQGQHTGLAAQVAAGEIDVVVIDIGSNDFAPYRSNGYEPIYDGSLSEQALTAKINDFVASVTTAVDTIRQAQSDIPIVLMTVPDWNLTAGVLGDSRFPEAARRQRVSDAIAAANAGLREMAQARDIVMMDVMAVYEQIAARVVEGQMIVGDVGIDVFAVGDEPHNGVLGDSVHGGTVAEGLLANGYIEAINTAVGAGLTPLSDEEILANAGL